jgi:hypothetical protein
VDYFNWFILLTESAFDVEMVVNCVRQPRYIAYLRMQPRHPFGMIIARKNRVIGLQFARLKVFNSLIHEYGSPSVNRLCGTCLRTHFRCLITVAVGAVLLRHWYIHDFLFFVRSWQSSSCFTDSPRCYGEGYKFIADVRIETVEYSHLKEWPCLAKWLRVKWWLYIHESRLIPEWRNLFPLELVRCRICCCLVRFDVFTAVTMKNGVFWDVTPCGFCKSRRFRVTYRLHHQGDKNRRASVASYC